MTTRVSDILPAAAAHADRPAAPASAPVLFSCADHLTIDRWNGVAWETWLDVGAAVTGISLAELNDVDATVPADGEVLTYGSGTWGPAPAAGGGAAADVTYSNATSGLTAADVQAAIDELAAGSGGGGGGSIVPTPLAWGAVTSGDSGAGDVTAALPAHSAGDMLVWFGFRNDSGGIGAPAGWSTLHGGGGTDRNHVFWKIAGASEANPTFTVGAYCTWIALVVTGGAMKVPVDFGWSDAAGQQVAIPNLQGSTLVGVLGGQYNAQGAVPAAPAGWTRRAAVAGSAQVGFYTDDAIGAEPIAALNGFPLWSVTFGVRELQPDGMGLSDPRKLFRDDCCSLPLSSKVTATGGIGFDTYDLVRTVTGVATYTTPPFPLRGTPVVELSLAQRSQYAAGSFRVRIKKQSTGATVAWLDFANDSNVVAYDSANAPKGNINTGGTSGGFTDGTSVRAALSVDKSGLCTATISAVTGGSGTSNTNSQQAWGVQTLKWASGLAGLAAGDQLIVELSQDKPGANSRVVALSRIVITNGARG